MSGSSVVARRVGRVVRRSRLGSVRGLSMSGSSVIAEFRGAIGSRPGSGSIRGAWSVGSGWCPKYVPNIVSKHTVWVPGSIRRPRSSGVGKSGAWGIKFGVVDQEIGEGWVREGPWRPPGAILAALWRAIRRASLRRPLRIDPGRFQEGSSDEGSGRGWCERSTGRGGRGPGDDGRGDPAEEVLPGRAAFGLQGVESVEEPARRFVRGGGFWWLEVEAEGGRGRSERSSSPLDLVPERRDLAIEGFDPFDLGFEQGRRVGLKLTEHVQDFVSRRIASRLGRAEQHRQHRLARAEGQLLRPLVGVGQPTQHDRRARFDCVGFGIMNRC